MKKVLLSPQDIAIALLPIFSLALLGIGVGHRAYVEPLFIHTTYYFLLVMVLCWAGTYILSARDLTPASIRSWVKENAAGIVIALAITAIATLAVQPGLRVLSDETNLLGTSKNFFFNKVATFTTTGKWYYDNFWDAGVVIDRRPALFPFLVSLLHVVRGYTYTNTFLLNLVVLPVFVLTAYRLAKSLGGEVFGVASALLVAAHPITLMSVRSGGFDFIAAFFSLLIVKNFLDHCRAPSADRLAILWMNLCLFVEIRYESGLFFFPVVFFLLIFRLAKLDYIRPYRFLYALTPAFFLPRIWQAILRGNVPEQDPGAITFSGHNFLENTRDYFKVIFSPFDIHWPHSPFVIGLGVAGCILAIVWMVKKMPSRDRPVAESKFALMVLGWMGLQLIIVFTYVWGRPLHPASARLIIAIDTFFSFPAAWALTVLLKRLRPAVTAVICAGLFVMYLPTASEGRLLNELTLTRHASTAWRFFQSLHENRILIITDRPGLYTVMNYGALDFEAAKQDPSLLDSLARRLFYDIYIIQEVDLATHKPQPQFEIWPEREKQTMIEFQNDANGSVRISRLVR